MKLVVGIFMIIFLIFNLNACVIVADKNWSHQEDEWKSRQETNKHIIHQLELNETRDSIVLKLGDPDFSEAFSKGNFNYRILFYRTQRIHEDGNTSLDETTPLVFKSDRLVGWGNGVLESIRQSQ